MTTEMLAQIRSEKRQPKFVAGIVLRDDVVVEAAPIIGYMSKNRWSRIKVREYCKRRGWEIQVVNRKETCPGLVLERSPGRGPGP